MKKNNVIEVWSSIVLVIMFGVLMFLSMRYMIASDYIALHCEYNHITNELISCK